MWVYNKGEGRIKEAVGQGGALDALHDGDPDEHTREGG